MTSTQVQAVVQGLSKARGNNFFSTIVQELASTINADYTFIARLNKELTQANTIALYADGKIQENISYDLAHTPCHNLTNENCCLFNGNVQSLFPKDTLLAEMNVKSYVGVPLYNHDQSISGILVALYKDNIQQPENAQSLFLLFSGLISGEIERKQHINNYQLVASVIQKANEAIIISDANQNITYVNPAFERITGYSYSEAVGKKTNLLNSGYHDKDFYLKMWQSLELTGKWTGEIWNKRKNGSIYPEQLTINAVVNDQGEAYRYVAFFTDISLHKNTEEKLNFHSKFDSLTHLPNMQVFFHRIEQGIIKAEGKQRLAVAMLDIDGFRHINDSYGHTFGNQLLKAIGYRLSSNIREIDTIARLSADKFPLIINDIKDENEASLIIKNLQSCLKEPIVIDNQEFQITSSAGISIYPDDSNIADDLISFADQAINHAKEKGSNAYHFFDPSMQAQAERKMTIRREMAQAISNREFSVVYQPIIDIASGRPVKFEALVRWQHQGQWVSPEEFIPIAEDFGLIVPLGMLIMEKSCAALQKLHQAGFSDIVFAINRSVYEFPDTVQGINHWLDMIKKHQLPASAICFELTESILAPDSIDLQAKFQLLKDAGCSLSIDDFGTGYSSLSYLQQFPVDILKIDRSFISGGSQQGESSVLVPAIIAMAKALNLKVIAEGVETQSQLNKLKQLDCDFAQGYFYSRPLPESELEDYLTCHWTSSNSCSPASTLAVKSSPA